MTKQNESIYEWAKNFKTNHACMSCPFVKNHADVGVGGGIYDCDHVCAMEVDEIVAYAAPPAHSHGDGAFCADAVKLPDGKCEGYQKSPDNDKPTDRCMECPENQFFEGDGTAFDDSGKEAADGSRI